MITQKSVQEILAVAKVEEVIEDFVNLKRRGVNLIGLCPFHNEKTPSFTVSPAKNIYKCFGCGEGGYPVNFVMQHEGFSFPEALRYLAEKYNIEVEETEDTQEELDARALNDSLYIINNYAKEYFQKNLLETTEGINIGKSYFKERGFTDTTIEKFELGYASGEPKDFYEHANRKQLNLEYTKDLGLISKNDYDFFRARVMFSIHNLSGKVIAFAGRTMSTDKKTPKYINSPESEIYNKRDVLYAMNFAKNSIRKADECIIVEGYTDVITLHQGMIENVVASSGTSLTEGQIRLVRRYTQNIKIIYDGDAAGVKAALRGLDLVLEQDMNVKLVLLPQDEDPDSYLKKIGTDAFKQYLIDHEEDFVIFKTNLLLDEVGNDPIKKSVVLKDIVQSIARIPDPIKRSIYIQECSKLMEMDENIIANATQDAHRKIINEKKEYQRRDQLQQSRRTEDLVADTTTTSTETKILPKSLTDRLQEEEIVRILVNFGNKILPDENVTVSKFIFDNVEPFKKYMENEMVRSIVFDIKEMNDQTGTIDIDSFAQQQTDEVRKFIISFLTSPYEYADWEGRGVYLQNQKKPEDNYVKDCKQVVKRFLLRKVEKQKKEFIEKMNDEDLSEEERLLNIKIYQRILDTRNQLADELGVVTNH